VLNYRTPLESISEQKNKMVLKPQNFITCEEYSEYSELIKKDIRYFKGQVVKKGYVNIYKAYILIKNDCEKSDKLLTDTKTIEKLIEITDKFFSISMGTDSKLIDKKLIDITNIVAIKIITNID